MIIHLIRHAEAVERTPELSDEIRFLTPRGRKRFRRIGSCLKKAGIEPDVIFTSPLVRAVQTAEILAQALKFKGDLVATPLLAHGFRTEELDKLIQSFPRAKELVLVGHEPELGTVASTLLAAKTSCTLPKGAALTVKMTPDTKEAVFRQFVDGNGEVINSRSKALKRLNNG
jgi:phosphohistidine phosphatase